MNVEAFRLGGMAPSLQALPQVQPDEFVQQNGRPTAKFREVLRAIPSWRNALSVVFLYAQTLGIIVGAIVINSPISWIAAFFLMGRAHAQFASLMHEAAHRLLFSNRQCNDFVGAWLLGFVGFTSTAAYRRVHMAHHRQEFGPDEPDIPLYANYPITRASFRRKLLRDATGRTGVKLLRQQLRGLRSRDPRVRRTLYKILGVQVVLLGVSVGSGHLLIYFLLWLAPYLTVWRVINRLRSIAEHGGMTAGSDRRITTHCVRQHWAVRFFFVPYNIGFHLAHHVDAGVPFRALPKFHRHLETAGYVTPFDSYRSLWRAARQLPLPT